MSTNQGLTRTCGGVGQSGISECYGKQTYDESTADVEGSLGRHGLLCWIAGSVISDIAVEVIRVVVYLAAMGLADLIAIALLVVVGGHGVDGLME